MQCTLLRKKRRSRLVGGLKKATHIFLGFTMMLWTFGPAAPLLVPIARAANNQVTAITSIEGASGGPNYGVVITFNANINDGAGCPPGSAPGITCFATPGTHVLTVDGQTYSTVSIAFKTTSTPRELTLFFQGLNTLPGTGDSIDLDFTVGNFFTLNLTGGLNPASIDITSPPAPILSGGGPQNGELNSPTYPLIDISSDINLDADTVNTTNVTLLQCTGTDNATSCPSTTGSNLCSNIMLNSNTLISCILSGALSSSTTYKFTVGTGVQSAEGVSPENPVIRIFRTGNMDFGMDSTAGGVSYTFPSPGTMNFPANGNLRVEFRAGMNRDTSSSANFANSIVNAENIKLQVSNYGTPSGSNLLTNGDLSYESSNKTLTINPASNLSAAEYVLTIMSNVTTETNEGDPQGGTDGNALGMDYIVVFTASATSDTTAPTINNTLPNTAVASVPENETVETNISEVNFFFSEPLSSATVTTNTVQFFKDSDENGTRNNAESVSNNVSLQYNSFSNEIVVAMTGGFLDADAAYCTSFSTGITDTAGNALAETVRCFKTGLSSASDDDDPKLMYADADNFRVWIQFDEPLTSASAENAVNYQLETYANDQDNGSRVNLTAAGVDIVYHSAEKAVEISGLTLTTGNQFEVTVNNVADRNGNTIAPNSIAKGMVQDAAATGGYLGSNAGNQNWETSTDQGSYWESPQSCWPRSTLASQSTSYECEFNAPISLTTGANITLTFPTGFVVTNAAAISTTNSFSNSDMNGPGPGITTFKTSGVADDGVGTTDGATANDGVTINSNANTVTIHLSHTGDSMPANDHLRFEIEGITNGTAGEKNITAIIKDANGVKQGETINFPPIMIGEGGNLSAGGSVYKDSNGNGTKDADEGINNVKVFCDSMGGFVTGSGDNAVNGAMVGHVESTTSGNGSYTCSGLTVGQYGVGIAPIDTSQAGFEDIMMKDMYRDVYISETSVTGVDFIFTDLSTAEGAQDLSVTISSGATLSDDKVDVFCHAGGFDFNFSAPVMKVVTLNGSGVGTATVKLLGGKTYQCGVGPHIEFANFSAGGPPPMPEFNFMPPMPQQVVVPADSAPSAITFALEVADYTIKGKVVDGSGNGIQNVFVNANPKNCFDSEGDSKACFGGFTQTNDSGEYTLNVSSGTYNLRADLPGGSPSENYEVTVGTDGTLMQKGTTVTNSFAAGIQIRISKSSTTVSGQVQDESGNGLKFAHVDAQRIASGGSCDVGNFTPTGGFSGTPTDNSGNYTLYVGSGTWNIRAFNQTYGEIACKTVTVSDSSSTGQTLKATAGNYGTISGTAPDAFITMFGPNGGNNTQASNGTYSMKVKAGTYTVECFAHGTGPCGRQTSVSVSAGGTATADFSTSITTGTVNVTITGITDAFVDVRNSSGQGAGTGKNNAGVYQLILQPGTYTVRGGGPRYGELCSGQTVTITANQTSSVTCTPPSNLRTFSGRITDGSSNVSGATVTLSSSDGKFVQSTTGSKTGSDTNLSVSNIPDGTYTLVASKSGYEPASTTATVSSGSLTLSTPLAMTKVTSGTNGATVNIPVQTSGSAYTGSARVVAVKSDGKTISGEMTKTTGQTTLILGDGAWTVTGYGDNGKKSSSETLTISGGAAASTPTLSLATAITGFTAASDSATLSPVAGGLITSNSLGIEVNVPASTLSTTDSSTAKVEMKKDATMVGSDPGDNLNFVGSNGFDITPKDANGNKLGSSLTGDAVTLKIPYTDADVASAGVDESKLVVGSIDANGDWETFPTTVDATNNILSVKVSHFSGFGVLGGASSSTGRAGTDTVIPGAPKNFKATQSGSSVTLSWDAVSDADLKEYQILRGIDPVPPSATVFATIKKGTQTYTDSAVEVGKKYRYQILAVDTSGNKSTISDEISITVSTATTPSSSSSGGGSSSGSSTSTSTGTTISTPATTTTTTTTTATSTTTTTANTSTTDARSQQIERIKTEALKVIKGAQEIATAMSMARDSVKEVAAKTLIEKFSKAAASDSTTQAFIAYGTAESKSLGSGERAGVVSSFMTAYGKSPSTEIEWQDVLKIGAGRFPSTISSPAEANAKTSFKKIYKRDANISQANDSAAVTIMAYGLRPSTRNLSSEATAIKSFKAIYGKNPSTASDWDQVRAIAYSGAKR